jgi:hypothetical protein
MDASDYSTLDNELNERRTASAVFNHRPAIAVSVCPQIAAGRGKVGQG